MNLLVSCAGVRNCLIFETPYAKVHQMCLIWKLFIGSMFFKGVRKDINNNCSKCSIDARSYYY